MRRQLKQVRPSARHPAHLEPDPHTSMWTSHVTDEVTALLARIEGLIDLRKIG
jgi:hypothetical protein